jgi:NAD(P)H dehydrogenase (quinone)
LSKGLDERNVLIVYAHHDDHSFVGAVRDLVRDTLSSRGFFVFESPLYEMKFNPVMSIKEFMVDLEDNNDNEIIENGFQALPNCHIPIEVKEEMNKVMAAHYVVFVFPLWWERY